MKNIGIKYFTILEIICALALFAVLTTAFFGALDTLRQMDRDFTSENRALMVLDNTFERLDTMKNYTSSDVEVAFLDEFAKSGLTRDRIKPFCRKHGHNIALSLVKKNGKPLIEVDLKCAVK